MREEVCIIAAQTRSTTRPANNSGFPPFNVRHEAMVRESLRRPKERWIREEVIEVGKVGGGAYEVIDCATGAKSTYLSDSGGELGFRI